jgi:hypothetical protein
MHLLGIEERVTADFMVGTWKCTDEFFRWGLTDKDKSTVKSLRGQALMTLTKDGQIRMTSFFIPSEGRWEVTSDGIQIHDPRFPGRPPQLLPVRKRDNDKIWILLPFTGGSAGIGMARVQDPHDLSTTAERDRQSARHLKGRESTYGRTQQSRSGPNRGPEREPSIQESDFLTIAPTRVPDAY